MARDPLPEDIRRIAEAKEREAFGDNPRPHGDDDGGYVPRAPRMSPDAPGERTREAPRVQRDPDAFASPRETFGASDRDSGRGGDRGGDRSGRDDFGPRFDGDDDLRFEDYAPITADRGGRRPWLPILMAVVVLLVLGGVIFYAYSWFTSDPQMVEDADVPIVVAEEGSVREEPAPGGEGGMTVEGTETTVLNQGNGTTQLLPLPPAPGSPTTSEPALTVPPPPPIPLPPSTSGTTPPVPAAPAAPAVPEPATTAVPTAPAAPEPAVPEPAQVATATPSPPTPTSPSVSVGTAGEGPYGIQLASLQSEDGARQEWDRIKGRNSGLLGDMSLFIQDVAIEGRGTFYRIQTGPFENRATAEDMCAQLIAAGQDCIVVRR